MRPFRCRADEASRSIQRSIARDLQPAFENKDVPVLETH